MAVLRRRSTGRTRAPRAAEGGRGAAGVGEGASLLGRRVQDRRRRRRAFISRFGGVRSGSSWQPTQPCAAWLRTQSHAEVRSAAPLASSELQLHRRVRRDLHLVRAVVGDLDFAEQPPADGPVRRSPARPRRPAGAFAVPFGSAAAGLLDADVDRVELALGVVFAHDARARVGHRAGRQRASPGPSARPGPRTPSPARRSRGRNGRCRRRPPPPPVPPAATRRARGRRAGGTAPGRGRRPRP